MFELLSALFLIAESNEFRLARFYHVCEEVCLVLLGSPLIVCGLSDTFADCSSVAKTRNELPKAAGKKLLHFVSKTPSRCFAPE